jgi:hypothetical protein
MISEAAEFEVKPLKPNTGAVWKLTLVQGRLAKKKS